MKLKLSFYTGFTAGEVALPVATQWLYRPEQEDHLSHVVLTAHVGIPIRVHLLEMKNKFGFTVNFLESVKLH